MDLNIYRKSQDVSRWLAAAYGGSRRLTIAGVRIYKDLDIYNIYNGFDSENEEEEDHGC